MSFDAMAFDAEGLLDFTEQTEGAPPPVFVGRDDILEDIEKAGSLAWNDRQKQPAGHGAPKNTKVVQGAPGAGKSSTLAELFRRSAERAGAPGQSRVITVSSRQLLDSLPDVLRVISAAGSLGHASWRQSVQRFIPKK